MACVTPTLHSPHGDSKKSVSSLVRCESSPAPKLVDESSTNSELSWIEAEFDTIEETLNVITHLLAVAPGIAAVAHLLARARRTAQTACAVIYGTAMISLFLGSSIYHVTLLWPRFKPFRNLFLRIDRSMIYVFIAAYCTPYVVLSGLYWVSVLGVWALCVLCLIFQNLLHDWHGHQAMFIALAASVPSVVMVALLPSAVANKVVLGGIAYTIGFGFYNLQGRMRFAHALWHCCVNVATWLLFDAMAEHLYSSKTMKNDWWISLTSWLFREELNGKQATVLSTL
ncbi:monocyte to macrophage differentiation factor 2-like [Varroa destructor]|uniref:Uncharacterized protein n=1 Tax=Varroa destructor TaxID=109461 RepID=A0A7M7KV52_VARDE|nr:monocyte to macrophage differentiation factor 2-like [Varroa destructor]